MDYKYFSHLTSFGDIMRMFAYGPPMPAIKDCIKNNAFQNRKVEISSYSVRFYYLMLV